MLINKKSILMLFLALSQAGLIVSASNKSGGLKRGRSGSDCALLQDESEALSPLKGYIVESDMRLSSDELEVIRVAEKKLESNLLDGALSVPLSAPSTSNSSAISAAQEMLKVAREDFKAKRHATKEAIKLRSPKAELEVVIAEEKAASLEYHRLWRAAKKLENPEYNRQRYAALSSDSKAVIAQSVRRRRAAKKAAAGHVG